MAGGSIFAGIYAEPYDISDSHTKTGVLITMISAAAVIFFVTDPLKGLIYSQMLLSVQLPVTIFTQIYLTSSKKVMGKYSNSRLDRDCAMGHCGHRYSAECRSAFELSPFHKGGFK